MKRPGNNPKRRVAPFDRLTEPQRIELADSAKYVASGHHKRNPADYGLERTNPRPTKSLCDALRTIPLAEAKALMSQGILYGMFSDFFFAGYPKFIWCVSDEGEVYEAKTDSVTPGVYHGYRLEEEDSIRVYIKQVWKERCQASGR
jgi:hypothetical protein